MSYQISLLKNGVEVHSHDVTDAQVKCLEHDLIDVQAWITHAATYPVIRKTEACVRRICDDNLPILEADDSVTSIPLDKNEMASGILARSDYKNRAAREDAEYEANL